MNWKSLEVFSMEKFTIDVILRGENQEDEIIYGENSYIISW